jgi:2-amino-4-hydroxy-6-hydroxymethyldihydropteridine diphosphokinase
MATIYLSIGSNINPKQNIHNALTSLRQYYGDLIVSPTYESESVGFVGDNFYNLVVAFETKSAIDNIIEYLREIENNNGRKRTKQRFNSRTLDLDLILYDNLIKEELNLPRDEILKYAFVLRPLADIAPNLKHPFIQQTYAELWYNFNDKQTLSLINIL